MGRRKRQEAINVVVIGFFLGLFVLVVGLVGLFFYFGNEDFLGIGGFLFFFMFLIGIFKYAVFRIRKYYKLG